MERKIAFNRTVNSSKRAILKKILSTSKRIIEREDRCFQKKEIEINYSALAQGLLEKYEELIVYYPDYSSSEFLQELKKKIEDVQHLKNPHSNMKLVSYLTEILLNKEEE